MRTRFPSVVLVLLAILVIFIPRAARAEQIITATVTVTNVAGTTNGETITLNAIARTWTNSVTSAQSQILTATNIFGATSNLFLAYAQYPATSIIIGRVSTNAVRFQSFPGSGLTLSISTNWGTLSWSTNTITNAMTAVRVPKSGMGVNELTNVVNGLVDEISDNSATNKVPTNAPAFSLFYSAIAAGGGTNGGGGSGIMTNGGSGIFNTLSNLTTVGDVDYSGYAPSNLYAVFTIANSAAYFFAWNALNTIAPAGQADYGGMYGGRYNRIGSANGAAPNSLILGGADNLLAVNTNASSGYSSNSVIVGGQKSFMRDANNSVMLGGQNNFIYGSEGSIVLGGSGNLILNSHGSTVGGTGARTAFDHTFVWCDISRVVGGAIFAATDTNQFLVYAQNGVCINTNYAGTNALRVSGNIDAAGPGAGFTINGQPFTATGTNYIYTIGTNTSFLLGIDITADSAVTNFWWNFNLTNAAGSRSIYQSILATANVNFLGVTNIQRWDLLSFDVVASGGSRTITFPTNLFRMKTNGLSVAGTRYSYLLENGKLFRGSIHTNSALEFIWNATDQ